MLEMRNVSKRFSGSLAVDNVSFHARAGEVTGYLGPNGSGKSTTIKMIAGLIEPTSGEILFTGEPFDATSSPGSSGSAMCPKSRTSTRISPGSNI